MPARNKIPYLCPELVQTLISCDAEGISKLRLANGTVVCRNSFSGIFQVSSVLYCLVRTLLGIIFYLCNRQQTDGPLNRVFLTLLIELCEIRTFKALPNFRNKYIGGKSEKGDYSLPFKIRRIVTSSLSKLYVPEAKTGNTGFL